MKIASNLYLNTVTLNKAAVVEQSVGTDWIIIIDRSGSMSWDLPKIAEQIKLRLATMITADDSVTLIAFSGKGQCVLVFEQETIASLGDVQRVHDTKRLHAVIDKHLVPVGLTGFVEPLQMAYAAQMRIQASKPAARFGLFFMSDGHDNQWPRTEILQLSAQLEFDSATVVEFGRYADRVMLSQMAENLRGDYIIADKFDTYAPAFESVLQRSISRAPRHVVTLASTPMLGMAFAIDDTNEAIITFAADADNVISAPGDTTHVYYLSETPSADDAQTTVGLQKALYAALSILATKAKPKIMRAILRFLGDVRFVRDFAACYGKERYTDFVNATKAAVFDAAERGLDGYDQTEEPRADLVTLPDVLALLYADPDTRLLLDSKHFRYKRTGRKSIDSAETVTAAEQKELAQLVAAVAADNTLENLAALSDAVSRINATKRKINFVADAAPEGYPFRALEFASKRANINIGITRTGTVDLTSLDLSKAPWHFPTAVHRSYTVVKDGLVNIEMLPFTASDKTLNELAAYQMTGRMSHDALVAIEDGWLLDLSKLPMINQDSIDKLSAVELVTLSAKKLELEAHRKVYRYYLDELFPDAKLANFAELYGADDATLLKSVGVTEGGYNPRSTLAPSNDVYVGYELTVKLDKYSSLPKVEDVIADMQAGKNLTPSKFLLHQSIKHLAYKKDANDLSQAYLTGGLAKLQKEIDNLARQISRVTFAVIVGQEWFVEFASIDEGTIEVEVDDTRYKGTIEQKPVTIEI